MSPCATPFPAVMPPSPKDDPMSIFVDGRLKPGRYKVQNLASQTYLEILEHSKELCCRPATVLSSKDALVISNILHGPRMINVADDLQWDFQASDSGYRIKKVSVTILIYATHQDDLWG